MELKDIFSKRLRNARLMRGLSMQQLCVMMNDIVTKQSVSKYERGESMPDSTIVASKDILMLPLSLAKLSL